jgi:hypothetical protein
MKRSLLFLIVAFLVPTALPAQNRTSLPTDQGAIPVPANTTINVRTAGTELADGYAAAIPQMTLKSVVIFMKSEGKTVAIKGIRSARAMGGVLLIEFSAGDRLAVNAEQIVMITDGVRTP